MRTLALLCLLFLLPLQQQTKPEIYKCKLVNFDPVPRLVCNDKQQSVWEIPYAHWPEVWGGPRLDALYPVKAQGEDWMPLATEADPNVDELAEKQAQEKREVCGARKPPKPKEVIH